ncbi:MAG: tyrosine-type recombinase/integrase [Candidatus Xenobium sp.]|jgi:integrase|nr:site-specific integrase [Burkholderiales bacterium]
MARSGGEDRGLFERPAGSGVWWVRYVDREGREHREKVGSKSAAREVYRQRKTEVRLEKFDPEAVTRRRVLTVKGLVEQYQPEFTQKRSAKDDRRYARYWLEHMGSTPADQVRPEDVERWRRKRLSEPTRRGKPAAPATVNRAVAFLKRLFNLAIRDGLLGQNPVTRVKMLTENNARIRFLLDEEEERLRAVMSQEDWAIVGFALATGLRQGEMLSLRREDLDLRLGMITVRRSKHGEQRHVPMNQSARDALAVILGGHDSDWVFPAPKASKRKTVPEDQPRRGDSLYKGILVRACKKAGVKNLRWHDLRHTFCSRLVMLGVDLRTVQELAGHKSILMTQRYAHLSPAHQRAAVMALDERNRHQNRHLENVVSLEGRRIG